MNALADQLHSASVAAAQLADARDQATSDASALNTTASSAGSAGNRPVRYSAGASMGQWLRDQRRARGWSVPEMCRQLRQAAANAGDKLPSNECLKTMIRRWEQDNGGVSERYRLHFCKALGVPADQFGTAAIPASPSVPDPPSQDRAAEPVTARPAGTTPDDAPFVLWSEFTIVFSPACRCEHDPQTTGTR